MILVFDNVVNVLESTDYLSPVPVHLRITGFLHKHLEYGLE